MEFDRVNETHTHTQTHTYTLGGKAVKRHFSSCLKYLYVPFENKEQCSSSLLIYTTCGAAKPESNCANVSADRWDNHHSHLDFTLCPSVYWLPCAITAKLSCWRHFNSFEALPPSWDKWFDMAPHCLFIHATTDWNLILHFISPFSILISVFWNISTCCYHCNGSLILLG